MNEVKRAIILAAGIGKRLAPITLSTPKPLVKVNGVRMLDTLIDALHINGVFEIYVVVGYKKEQFDNLKDIPGVILIENPYFDTANNISSLYCARAHLEESIIMDGDQIVITPDILKRSFYKSGYNAVWTTNTTNEWLMQLNNGRVTSCSRTGGDTGWQLFSISRWTKDDGAKLRNYLELEFIKNNNRDIFWDDIALFLHPEDFDLGIIEMNYGDIIEIDNVKELADLDSSYAKFVGDPNE